MFILGITVKISICHPSVITAGNQKNGFLLFLCSNAGKGENLYSPIGNYQIPFYRLAVWKLYRSHLIFIFRLYSFTMIVIGVHFLGSRSLCEAVDFFLYGACFLLLTPPVASVVIY